MTAKDPRLETLDRSIEEHGRRPSALLEVLQRAQELYGYLERDMLIHISESLNLPPSRTYGAATFYNLFRFRKPGEHIVTPCLGTACYVKGVEDIISAIESEFGVKRGKSTPDGRLSLFVTRCIGACAMAPNVVLDGDVIGKATKEAVLERMRRSLGGGKDESV